MLVVVLTVIAYARSRSRDPGLTTELALFATYLIGVEASRWPGLGAASGVALAVLLAARSQLHRFATRWLHERELHDALMLAALALIVVPLIPNEPLPWLAGVRLRPLGSLVLVILLLQAGGHVALRLFGARLGLLACGFFGGFVSSTMTIATFGARSRSNGPAARLLAAAAACSGCATWLQLLLIAATLAPRAVAGLAAAVAAGALATLAAAAALLLGTAAPSGEPESLPDEASAVRLREALLVAAMLSLVTVVVSAAQRGFGTIGALAGAALTGLADAHAPAASLFALFEAGRFTEATLGTGLLLAIGANTITRLVTAWISGGAAFAWRVGSALLAGLAAATAALAA